MPRNIPEQPARRPQNAKRSFADVLLYLTPSIIGVLVMAGGWIAQSAATRATLNDHERRLTTIEQNYVPRAEHVAKDTLNDKVLTDIRMSIQDLRQDVRQLSQDVQRRR